MNQMLRIKQAYSQTPWRKQIQGMGMFLSVLILGALVAIVYLSVTSRTAAFGRKIQYTQHQIEIVEREIAEKQSSLAQLTSASEMERRAVEMGFRPVGSGQILYLVVDGYQERQAPQMAPDAQPMIVNVDIISPAFTESLLEWIQELIYLPPTSIGRMEP